MATVQIRFDWNRAARLKILERAVLLPIPERAQLRAGALLRVLESHCRESESCYLTVQTIALEMKAKESTTHRAIRDCEQAGLIHVERLKGRSSTFTLNWSLLIDLSQETIDEQIWQAMRSRYNAILSSRNKPVALFFEPSKGVSLEGTSDTPGVSLVGQRGVTCGVEVTPIIPLEAIEAHHETPLKRNGDFAFAKEPQEAEGRDHSELPAPNSKLDGHGWPFAITPNVLSSRLHVTMLFDHAVRRRWLSREDELRFRTLAQSVVSRWERPPPGRTPIEDVGKVFTKCVKRRLWLGSEKHERKARKREACLT